MKNQKNTEPQSVTKEILKKELTKSEKRLNTRIDGVEQHLDAVEQHLDAVEQRLDAKIDAKVDSAVQSMKDYTDSRFTQLETYMTQRFDKFEHYFEELTGMFVKQNKKIDTFLKQLNNHEHRITKLEQHSV